MTRRRMVPALGLALAAALLAAAGTARAQERIPTEEAQKIAKALAEQATKLDGLPLKTGEVDTDKPFAVRQDRFGAMAVPTKGLRPEQIGDAGKEITPIGQLWMRNLAPIVSAGPAPEGKLQTVKFEANDQTVSVTLYLMGVRKTAKGDLELVVFGKDKEPLLTSPIDKAESAQSYPIELEGREDGDGGMITFFLSGKFRTNLKVAPTE